MAKSISKSMSESKWLTSSSPQAVLNSMRTGNSRKLRLYACACCRHIWNLISDERSRKAVEAAELWADGRLAVSQLKPIQVAARRAQDEYTTSKIAQFGDATSQSLCAATGVVLLDKAWVWSVANHMRGAVWAANGESPDALVSAEVVQVHFLRDIFGNPFRPATVDQSWLRWHDGIVPKIAQAIYADRAFGNLPILADALEEAGCDDADILTHCRSGGEHVRGCWVVDLILGKS